MTANGNIQHPKRMRTCCVCGKSDTKMAFLRIVRTPDGTVFFDKTGRAAGRGAYVCSVECLEAAHTSRKFDRALKIKLTNEDYERVVAQAHAALVG